TAVAAAAIVAAAATATAAEDSGGWHRRLISAAPPALKLLATPGVTDHQRGDEAGERRHQAPARGAAPDGRTGGVARDDLAHQVSLRGHERRRVVSLHFF